MNDLEADLLIANAKIKQLEQQLTDYHHLNKLVNGKMAENQHLRRINENLQSQIAESQRREQAAVEDAKQGSVCRTCHYLNNGCDPLNLDAGCHKWQWRGPGAGEGAAK